MTDIPPGPSEPATKRRRRSQDERVVDCSADTWTQSELQWYYEQVEDRFETMFINSRRFHEMERFLTESRLRLRSSMDCVNRERRRLKREQKRLRRKFLCKSPFPGPRYQLRLRAAIADMNRSHEAVAEMVRLRNAAQYKLDIAAGEMYLLQRSQQDICHQIHKWKNEVCEDPDMIKAVEDMFSKLEEIQRAPHEDD